MNILTPCATKANEPVEHHLVIEDTAGQWLLFGATVSGQNKLQLVRMDGQFLQTLYCGIPVDVQWSTDQRFVFNRSF